MVASVAGSQDNFFPRASPTNPGITLGTRPNVGYVNVTNNQIYATIPGWTQSGAINLTVSGFERIVGTYLFTVKTYGNGTLNLLFYGIPPVAVKGSGLSASYNYATKAETVTYSTSDAITRISALQVIYSGVGPNISNAVASGSGLLIALVIVISTAFILILIVWIKAAIEHKDNPPLGIQVYYPTALLLIALLFLVILALIALFTPYFNGIGI